MNNFYLYIFVTEKEEQIKTKKETQTIAKNCIKIILNQILLVLKTKLFFILCI